MNHRLNPIALLGVAALLLSGCSGPVTSPAGSSVSSSTGSATHPVTVESCGADYTYTEAPKRVMLGAPGVIRTLDALGVGESAIGYVLSDYGVEATKKFPNLQLTSKDYTPSREFLISAKPDLFLANDEQQLLGQGAASKQDLAQIPANLYVLGAYCAGKPGGKTMDAVYTDVENLAKIYGVDATGVVRDLKGRVASAAARNPGTEKLTAAAVTIFDGKVYALSGSYYAAVLEALGLDNAFGDVKENFAEISAEKVLSADVDVIFVTYTDTPAAAIDEAKKLFANAPAIKDDRIYGMSETAFQSSGVAIVDVVEQAAKDVFGS